MPIDCDLCSAEADEYQIEKFWSKCKVPRAEGGKLGFLLQLIIQEIILQAKTEKGQLVSKVQQATKMKTEDDLEREVSLLTDSCGFSDMRSSRGQHLPDHKGVDSVPTLPVPVLALDFAGS
jgi:hypothetical protein